LNFGSKSWCKKNAVLINKINALSMFFSSLVYISIIQVPHYSYIAFIHFTINYTIFSNTLKHFCQLSYILTSIKYDKKQNIYQHNKIGGERSPSPISTMQYLYIHPPRRSLPLTDTPPSNLFPFPFHFNLHKLMNKSVPTQNLTFALYTIYNLS
jgi:hypothetical protein